MKVNCLRMLAEERAYVFLGAFTVFLVAWCLAFGVSSANPTGLASEDEVAIRDVIGRQLDAFQRDQAELAFSYASPGIQKKFGSPTRFLSMVKSHYSPVYRPREIEFRSLVNLEGTWVQEVMFAEGNGNIYIAHYPMELQADGKWLIDGCVLTLQTDKNI